MARIDLGKITFSFKGKYKKDITYEKKDIVYFRHSSFVCLVDNTLGIEPSLKGNAHWQVIIEGLYPFKDKGDLLYHDGSDLKVLPLGPPNSILVTNDSDDDIPIRWDSLPEYRKYSAVKNIVQCPDNQASNSFDIHIVMSDNTLRGWGKNNHSQLGIGNTVAQTIPQIISFDEKDMIKAFYHNNGSSYVITDNGTVYSWGYGQEGTLGHGDNINVDRPKKIIGLKDIKIDKIFFCYKGVFFLTEQGDCYACGLNNFGQLSLGNNNLYNIPHKNNTNKEKIISITSGNIRESSVFFLTEEEETKKVYCYATGFNKNGVLGIGDTTSSYISMKQKVSLPLNIKKISTHNSNNDNHSDFIGKTICITEDGRAYGWGIQEHGELGLGNEKNYLMPEEITGLGDDNKDVVVARHCSLIVKNDNSIWTAGEFVTGNGDSLKHNTYIKIPIPKENTSNNVKKIIKIGLNHQTSFAVLYENGELFVWGDNDTKQIGLGTIKRMLYPFQHKFGTQKIIDIASEGGFDNATNKYGLSILTSSGSYYLCGDAGLSFWDSEDMLLPTLLVT